MYVNTFCEKNVVFLNVEPGGTQSNHKGLKSQFYEDFQFLTNKINLAFTKKCIFITIRTMRGKAQKEEMDGSYSIDCNKNYVLRFSKEALTETNTRYLRTNVRVIPKPSFNCPFLSTM